jgi:hypothetical protein
MIDTLEKWWSPAGELFKLTVNRSAIKLLIFWHRRPGLQLAVIE